MQSKGNGVYSVIDLGTNTCLLLTARIENGVLTKLYEAAETPRIGKGIYSTGNISEDSLRNVESIFLDYKQKSLESGATEIFAFGTSALREAKNSLEFINRIEASTGIRISVITGEEEAVCAYKGATYDLPGGNYTVIDIGGGSTELSYMKGESLRSISIDAGSVRLTEKFFGNGYSREAMKAAADFIGKLTDSFPGSDDGRELVGVAGTLTTLSCIRQGLRDFDPEKVHGDSISIGEVTELTDKLAGMSESQKLKLGSYMPGRSDIIAAGALILREVMKRLGHKKVLVSAKGLRYGLMLRLVDFSKMM